MLKELKDKVMNGIELTREQADSLLKEELQELSQAADEIRQFYCGNGVELCTIINGKSGQCSENCKYCAQSAHFQVKNIEQYDLLATEQLLQAAQYSFEKGIFRYSVVTSGKRLNEREVEQICKSYQIIREKCGISLCASHGLLTYPQLVKLKEAGVTRYHNNLETSRRFFPHICTTHTYDEKVETIENAKKAGMEICSGGIMGLGETMEDRIDMAFELKRLQVQSIPINVLNPITGTPLGENPMLSTKEIQRIVAVFRFILPKASIRLAGGRGLLNQQGKDVFLSGANAAISGDMLTTAGISIDADKKMLEKLGFEVKRL
ncbi:biotin synthase BioB [Anaeromicropila populeti]|uniref:Biotin synthase n=1 Tax=Anaeromicropila populeti TaxID=37658 RepID=A0A1I6JWQ1_9FIRM|nr:biotin synthase BioB [Anaeromicropila populeti]SFR83402.1 biotin synthase [Anaeromicropila populeti]